MATRIFFKCSCEGKIIEEEISFQFSPGFSVTQKQKSICSFHNEIKKIFPESNILEISSKSPPKIGRELSAFNLMKKVNGRSVPVENIFQSSKQFSCGGPYSDLLYKSPWEAKKDKRLYSSGSLIAFSFDEKTYPLEPQTAFYDWIYCNAIKENSSLICNLMAYDIFTDIEFNHKKSINCQARSAAIFVSLFKQKKLDTALLDFETFKKSVY